MTPDRLSRRSAIATVGSVVALAGCLSSDTNTDTQTFEERLSVSHATQYNAPGCGCCEGYATYLDEGLDADLRVEEPDDIRRVKREYGVSEDLESCHTIELDEYVVEGHVPAEAIATLLDDRPDVAGIALPGMPAGTPGMPGEKDGTWTVYAFDGGEYEPFTRL